MRLSDSQERTESEWALEALRCEGHSLQELLDLWEFENAPEDEWEEYIRAIQRGLDGLREGRTVDAFESAERLRRTIESIAGR